MKMIRNTDIDKKVQQKSHEKSLSTYIALGFFDGVHLGHQALLKLCIEKARTAHAVSTVILFDPHPDKIVKQLNSFYLLTTLPERVERIKQLGIQQIIIIDFTAEFQKMSAENFITRILLKKFNMRAVFVGYNYHFGYQKKGDINLIERLSRTYQFKYFVIDPIKIDNNQGISSTMIKEQLKRGNILRANQLLGYPYQMTGKVIHGDKRGKAVLSFPTANVEVPQGKLLPKNGVYISLVQIKGQRYQGLVNIGTKPTFKKEQRKVEVEAYVFNFNDNIYHKEISVSLLKRIRDEKKFSGIEDLTLQIHRDKIRADAFFKEFHFNCKDNDYL